MKKLKFKINKIFNYIFGEKFYKKLDFYWDDLPKRYDLINRIIEKKKYENYLEIGCDDNHTFDQIKISKKIGVDPYKGGNVRKTSDIFFAQNIDKFDCIFIDGLHTYEQVSKDVANAIKVLKIDGTIFIHDCLPRSYFDQAVPRSKNKWNGDVWKVIVEYRMKEEFDTCTCFIDHGVGIIKIRENSNLLKNNINNIKKLKFKDFYFNHKNLMNIIEFRKIDHFLGI